MTRVAYFSNQFADLQGHGIARYSRELFAALQDFGDVADIRPVASWSSIQGKELEQLQVRTGLNILPWGRKLTPLSWVAFDRPRLESWLSPEVDVVHAVSLGYPIATAKPYVVTVHDLGPLTHPQYFQNSGSWIMRKSLAQAVRRAEKFICVSRSTADELISVAGDGVASRVEVIAEGVSANFYQHSAEAVCDVVTELGLGDRPYILSTGKLSPRKNIKGLVEALSTLKDQIPHQLVLVGGDGWSVEETYDTLDRVGMRDRVHLLGYVSDGQLQALYQHANVYLHPSLYEGFGLPVLEAMASGCPVVTSNLSSLPEVAGDAALLVDPLNREDIAQAIFRVCTDQMLARELREKGVERAARFSWRDCASKVVDVYSSVAE